MPGFFESMRKLLTRRTAASLAMRRSPCGPGGTTDKAFRYMPEMPAPIRPRYLRHIGAFITGDLRAGEGSASTIAFNGHRGPIFRFSPPHFAFDGYYLPLCDAGHSLSLLLCFLAKI